MQSPPPFRPPRAPRAPGPTSIPTEAPQRRGSDRGAERTHPYRLTPTPPTPPSIQNSIRVYQQSTVHNIFNVQSTSPRQPHLHILSLLLPSGAPPHSRIHGIEHHDSHTAPNAPRRGSKCAQLDAASRGIKPKTPPKIKISGYGVIPEERGDSQIGRAHV